MAECRVASKSKARGAQASDWELGVTMGEIRRSLFLAFVRAEVGGNYKRPKSKIAVWGIRVVLRG